MGVDGMNGDVPNEGSSNIVGNQFIQNLKSRNDMLLEEIRKYDKGNSGTVTKTEFRNALENVGREPIPGQLFEKLVDGAGFAINYANCLEKIGIHISSNVEKPTTPSNVGPLRLTRSMTMLPSSAGDTEAVFKQKLQENVTKVLRGLRLFDYNRDCRIQKHELKKVLDMHVMKLTDPQFERIWSRYESNPNSGTSTTNYQDFLRRVGISEEQLAKVATGAKSEKQSKNSQVLPESVLAAYVEQPPQSAASTARRGQSVQSALRPLSRFKHVVRNEDIPNSQLSESNIDFLEDQLRAGVLKNRQSIVKMFNIFDVDGTGFVSLEELHKTLNGFVFTMTFPVFQQLMDRVGLRASHTIAWRSFMRKFDPITYGEQQNGSFIPMRNNHKSFPVKGSDQKLTINTLLTKLHEHMRNGYPSMKEAFLTIAETRNSILTASKLQKVLSDRVKISVTDAQMAELWSLLQPPGSPPLDYQRFLDLFEVTDTADGHKWLQSCHRVNDVRHPQPLPGNYGAEIVRGHVNKNWSSIANDLSAFDRSRSGLVPVAQLKNTIVNYAGPVDQTSFSKWVTNCSTFKCCGDTDDTVEAGQVDFREFFSKLGCEVQPGDMNGLSMRIFQENANKVDKLIEDQRTKHQIEATKAADRANQMSVDEVLIRLCDRFEQRSSNVFKTFAYFAKKRKQSYRLSRNGFRKMLTHMGYLLTDDNFAELCKRLNFSGNYMTYDDFSRSFEYLFFQQAADVDRKNNHRYNAIRGDEQPIDNEAAYSLFKTKVLNNFDTLRNAFDFVDVEKRGVLGKTAIRRMFDHLNIPVQPGCIDEVMKRLGEELNLPPLEIISLDQFKAIFEFKEDERGHKWKSDHRFNKQVQGDFPTTPEGALQMLLLKLKAYFNSPTEAFLAASRKTGKINKRDFRNLFNKVHMDIREPMLTNVWDIVDPIREGSVNMEAFLRRLGVDNPGDSTGGVSEKIINKSEATLEEMLAKMKERHQLATDRQATVGQTMLAEMALTTIGQKLVDSGQSLDSLFAKFDVKKRGYLSAQQMQTILHTYHLFLSPSEEKRFLTMVGIGTNNRSVITLADFKAAFNDQQVVIGNENCSTAASKPDIRFPPPLPPDKMSFTTNAELWRRVRMTLTQNCDMIQRAFTTLDKSSSGRLNVGDFERVLVAFCGPRIPLQLIQTKLPPTNDGTIDYRSFLNSVTVSSNVPVVNAASMNPLAIGNDQLVAGARRLAHLIRAKHYHLIAACEELDYSRYGWLTMPDFRNVLQQFTFTITDQFFNFLTALKETMPTNQNGNVLYREALSALATVDQTLPAPSGEALPPMYNEHQDDSPRAESTLPPIDEAGTMMMSGSGRAMSVASSRASSTIASSVITDLFGGDIGDFGFGGLPMVDAARAENQLYPTLVKRWRRFHRACRSVDSQQTGFVPTPTVDRIFQEIGITLPDGDFQLICRKYDMRNSGSFAYRHFLRQLIVIGGNSRSKLTSSDPVAGGQLRPVDDSISPMLRVLLSTADRWRDLRRWFRSQPQSSPGVVTIAQLRNGLRTATDTNMTEEQFAELTDRLDPQNTGNIRFDDLFRLALKSLRK